MKIFLFVLALSSGGALACGGASFIAPLPAPAPEASAAAGAQAYIEDKLTADKIILKGEENLLMFNSGSCQYELTDDDGYASVASIFMAMKDTLRQNFQDHQMALNLKEGNLPALRKALAASLPLLRSQEKKIDGDNPQLLKLTKSLQKVQLQVLIQSFEKIIKEDKIPRAEFRELGITLGKLAKSKVYARTSSCSNGESEKRSLSDFLAAGEDFNWDLQAERYTTETPVYPRRGGRTRCGGGGTPADSKKYVKVTNMSGSVLEVGQGTQDKGAPSSGAKVQDR